MNSEEPKITIFDHTGARHQLPLYDANHALIEAIKIRDTVGSRAVGQTSEVGQPIENMATVGGKERR